MTTRPVRGLGAALVLAGSLGLSGCAVLSPVQTDVSYNAADGVPVDLGAVKIDNLLVVSSAKDGPGVVSASVTNESDKTVAIAVKDQVSGAVAQFDVPAFGSTQVSGTGKRVQLDKVSGGPGTMVRLTISSVVSGTSVVEVPVLLAQSYYETLAPTAPASTAVPTPSETTTAAG